MALIKIEPYIIDATGDFTFNNVTATGNLSSLNANLGNIAIANYFSGSGANLTNLPAGNVSGQVSNALVSGTVYTNAQPNITSVGTLTSLTATGNVTGGNLITAGKVYASEMLNGGTGIYLSAGPSGYINFFTTGGDKASVSDTGNIIASNLIANSTVFAVTANISGNVNAGNANLGNALTANFFIGSGNNLSNIQGANVTGAVSSATTAGTVTTAAQPNITSVGTLTGLTSTGTINLTGASNVALGPVANVHITGGTNGYVLQTDGSGTLSWVAQSGGGTVSNISNGNSNVDIPSANGNVNISAVGNANVLVITGTGANITGTLNVTGNTTVGNLISSGTGGNISNANVISANTFIASGNITAGNANLGNAVTSNYFIGSGANLTSLAGANVSGQVGNASVSGTVYTNAQPNITSVGTLTGITSTGTANLTGASNVALGPVANVHITGGSNGQYLQTDGSGTLTWSTVSSGSTSNISNGNSNVNIPTANGNVNISAVGNANILVVTGTGANITGTLNVTGNTTVGNLISSGSGGNISNANVISANTLTASGNINGADLNLSGNGVFGGNLTVNGTLTYINSTTLSISDPIINLQTGANGAAPTANSGKDVGTALNYYDTSAKIAWMGWDVSNAEIAFGSNVGISAEVVTFTSLANIRSGNATLGNLTTSNYFAGVLTTAAQPNITSTGTLTSLTVSGTSNLGAVGNVTITGGSNGQYLQTNGSGVLTWANVASGSTSNISNGNSNVSIAAANGNITMSAVGNANIVTVTGTGVNVAGTLNVTGQSNLGAVGNVTITGGSNTYVLSTDGAGNLSWTAPPAVANVTVDNFTGNGVQTVFTLSTTPTGINQTSVNYNGATVLRTDYTLANANITFSSAPANGSYIEVTTINLTTSGGGGGASSAAAVGYSLIFGG